MAKKAKKLLVSELVGLEKHLAKADERKLRKMNVGLKRQALLAQKSMLTAQIQAIDVELKLIEYQRAEMERKLELEIEGYSNLKKDIQARLKLEDNFGYDDETGEIIDDEL